MLTVHPFNTAKHRILCKGRYTAAHADFYTINGKRQPLAALTVCLLLFPFLVLIPKEKPPITVVGDVGGRIAIIVVSNGDASWVKVSPDLPATLLVSSCV